MRPSIVIGACWTALILLGSAAPALAQSNDPASLTQDEEDRIREAQDPSARIAVFMELAGERLERFNAIRLAPPDPAAPNRGATLDLLLSQYISLDDEMKRWIQDQFDTVHDMRKGLRALIDEEPKQLALLNHVQQAPNRYQPDYQQSLRDAIADLNDTLNGATQALADQEKKFGEIKRQEKVDAKAAKQAAEEEKKRQKDERKLRKKEERKGAPDDEDQNY
ncbi:MAG TPA: hypothetical protein VL523_14455 [Terriglobia bacterium]|nr:hypothetical protein [Terriglobia bacterium]